MNNRKRAITILLTITLVLTLMPMNAFAADESGAGEQQATEQVTVKTGFVRENGELHYYNANGSLLTTNGWVNIGGAKYYGLGGGKLATSPVKIKTTKKVTKKVKVKGKKKYKKVTKTETTYPLYMFGTDGKLINRKGLYTYNGKEYYGLGGGVLKTGWAAFIEKNAKRAAYFDTNTGIMAKNKKIKYLQVPKSGRLGEAYYYGVQKLDKTGWTLKQAYKNSYKIRYRNRWFRTKTSEQYAVRGFKTNKGNCYVMAATFYVQAKLLGYDIHQVQGKVAYRYPHSWTVIRQNGKEWVYDPNFKNETGRNGWKIWYGKKGTWKYTRYSKMN